MHRLDTGHISIVYALAMFTIRMPTCCLQKCDCRRASSSLLLKTQHVILVLATNGLCVPSGKKDIAIFFSHQDASDICRCSMLMHLSAQAHAVKAP